MFDPLPVCALGQIYKVVKQQKKRKILKVLTKKFFIFPSSTLLFYTDNANNVVFTLMNILVGGNISRWQLV